MQTSIRCFLSYNSRDIYKGLFESRRRNNREWEEKREEGGGQLGSQDLSKAVCDYGNVRDILCWQSYEFSD